MIDPIRIGLLMTRTVKLKRALMMTNTDVGVVGYTVGGHWWGERIESRQESIQDDHDWYDVQEDDWR